MKYRYLITLIIALLVMPFYGIHAQEDIAIKSTENSLQRDPFIPFSFDEDGIGGRASHVTNNSNPFSVINPTDNYPLNTYKVVGTIIAADKMVAAIKAKDHHDYYVTVGERLGNEGGIIADISLGGIKISIDGKILSIAVQNKFEIEDETS